MTPEERKKRREERAYYREKKEEYIRDSIKLLDKQAKDLWNLAREAEKKKWTSQNIFEGKVDPKAFAKWRQAVIDAEKPYRKKQAYYKKQYGSGSKKVGIDTERDQNGLPIQYYGEQFAKRRKPGPKSDQDFVSEVGRKATSSSWYRNVCEESERINDRKWKRKSDYCKAGYKIGNIFKTLGF